MSRNIETARLLWMGGASLNIKDAVCTLVPMRVPMQTTCCSLLWVAGLLGSGHAKSL